MGCTSNEALLAPYIYGAVHLYNYAALHIFIWNTPYVYGAPYTYGAGHFLSMQHSVYKWSTAFINEHSIYIGRFFKKFATNGTS